VVSNPSMDVLNSVLKLKTEVQRARQIISPQREVIARLAHGEFKVVRAHLLPYYRDLLDQLSRIYDLSESYHDSLMNILQVHLNLQQMQVNHVIKVLTVLATLSMPILIITSYYGMNIRHMPNTEWPNWKWAYTFIWGVTAVSTAIIYWLLKRKKWM
jgi:magnesium transporter